MLLIVLSHSFAQPMRSLIKILHRSLCNKKNPRFYVLAASLILSSCAVPRSVTSSNFKAENYGRVAVIAVAEQPNINPGLLRRMEDEFTMEIIGKGYSVVSRSDVQRVVTEMNFQASGLTDSGEKGAAKIGKILNVPGIVLVGVNNVAEQNHFTPGSSGYTRNKKGEVSSYSTGPSNMVISSAAISARLIDVQTTDVLWVGQASSGGGDSPLSILQSGFGDGMGGAENMAHVLAKRVAKTYPSRFPNPTK
jgi:hypothetical protein